MTTAVAEIRQFRQKNPSEKFPYPFRDLDRHQNLTSCCLVTSTLPENFVEMCPPSLLFELSVGQTDRETKEKT